MTTETHSSYDVVPYESRPFEQSHPHWLATVATLFGMAAPPIESARILELGCASGGNLVPLAEVLPNSSCLGIDLSSRQIEDGRAFARATGLGNVELRQASILDVDESYGQFDYILCHGVYSWVDRDVQQRILEICGQRLSPQGVAYVSYNTFPGWHMMSMLRDMMRFHSNRFQEPHQQIAQARALLEVLAKTVPSQDNPFGMLLKRESEHLRNRSDAYIYHEYLEQNNDPVHFHEFVGRATAAGLQFLGESDLRAMLTNEFSPEIRAALREVATNIVYAEQYMDFFRNRTFRRTLLCKSGVALTRKLGAHSVKEFSFSSALRPHSKFSDLKRNESVKFEGPGWPTISVADPMGKAILLCLRDAWPRHLSLDEIYTEVQARLDLPAVTEERRLDLADVMWRWFTQRIVHMSVAPPHCVARASERPLGSIVARTQAATGLTLLTNLLHRTVKLSRFDATVLTLLDGTLDRSAIVERMNEQKTAAAAGPETPATSAAPMQDRVEAALAVLADAALLRG